MLETGQSKRGGAARDANGDVELCYCGAPLHYSDPAIERAVRGVIAAKGTHVLITVGRRTWSVPRHYIALHGIKSKEIPFLGFEEIRE